MSEKLLLGIGREDITPEVGGQLQGYSPDVFSESVHDNLPFENIIIAATHTHSGPNISGGVGWGDSDMKYYNEVFM